VEEVRIAGVEPAFRWDPPPRSWSAGERSLAAESRGETDLFVDPGTGEETSNAPRLLGAVDGDFLLGARVTAVLRSTFDAGVLMLWAGARAWAKLCLELSPQGEPTVVSVVTRGLSDDCNSFAVGGDSVHLRIARLGPAFALHASTDGAEWRLIRHFALEPADGVRAGFLVQSPLGKGCSARFEQIAFAPGRLRDLRSGE
jgi:uncharacterized protein